MLLERRDRGGVGSRLLAEVGRHGVARDELREQEDDERDPDREEDERDRPTRDEATEGRGGDEAAPPGPARQAPCGLAHP